MVSLNSSLKQNRLTIYHTSRPPFKVLLNNTGESEKGIGSNILLFSGWQGSSTSITREINSFRGQGVQVQASEYGPPSSGRQSVNISGVLEPSRIYGYMPGSNPVEPPTHPVEPPEPVFRDLSNDPRLIQVSFTRMKAVD